MRRFLSFTLALCATGCQLVFPLADVDGTGGEGTSTTRATGVTGSAASPASGTTGPTGPGGPGVTATTTGAVACGDAACETYCAGVFASCGGTPQYHTHGECCVACSTWDENDRACRAPTGGDPLSCTFAGPFGGGLACANSCAELCALYAAVCPSEVPGNCESECASKWDGSLTFNACAPGPDDSRTCRMSRLLEAATSSDPMACKRAKDGKCPGMSGNVCM